MLIAINNKHQTEIPKGSSSVSISSPLVVISKNIHLKQLNSLQAEQGWVCVAYNTITLEESEEQNKFPPMSSGNDRLS